MGLVDVQEDFPAGHQKEQGLLSILNRFAVEITKV